MNELLELMKFKNLIDLSLKYYSKSLEPLSRMDIFVQYWIPILEVVAIIFGALFAIYTYKKSKNKEIYEKLLTEVYGPLYQYIVRQETFRKLYKIGVDYHEAPILELSSTKLTTKYTTNGISTTKNSEVILDLNKESFLKVLKNINVGLAPQTLVTLLNMYQSLLYIEGHSNEEDEASLNSVVLIVEVENKLRKEIITGYQKYHQKLGLKGGVKNDFLRFTDDQIDILLYPSGMEKDLYLKEIRGNSKK